ncbi:methyltransferase [Candidatus Marsarchaeota archaeon]|jgi:release factor glutamine methyltransferase|nr:methyltransferase [Candidatus Marsarchaeota archaeon]MCL5099696.1 methyltransferase [Candidatus Marsarchaeota archaeon]
MIYDSLVINDCTDVYKPREDTVLMAKAVEEHAFGQVLDLGTGTGALGIVAAKKGCSVTFADISASAVECAKSNAELNGVSGKFVVSDLFDSIRGRFDTIIFNPPYLPSETTPNDPKLVPLEGGSRGREVIDRFLEEYKQHVEPKHKVLLLESSMNGYEGDIARLGAKIIGKTHYFFEDLVVLLLEQ